MPDETCVNLPPSAPGQHGIYGNDGEHVTFIPTDGEGQHLVTDANGMPVFTNMSATDGGPVPTGPPHSTALAVKVTELEKRVAVLEDAKKKPRSKPNGKKKS